MKELCEIKRYHPFFETSSEIIYCFNPIYMKKNHIKEFYKNLSLLAKRVILDIKGKKRMEESFIFEIENFPLIDYMTGERERKFKIIKKLSSKYQCSNWPRLRYNALRKN